MARAVIRLIGAGIRSLPVAVLMRLRFRWCLVPALLLLVLAGCKRETHCKCELIDDSGKFEAIAKGRRPEDELRREALRAACDKRCAGTSGAVQACVSRCTVDAVVGKIGMRSTCSEGGR